METPTPQAQGFLINAKQIRVSRGLMRIRKEQQMDKWLIFHYLGWISRRDEGVTRAPTDGIVG